VEILLSPPFLVFNRTNCLILNFGYEVTSFFARLKIFQIEAISSVAPAFCRLYNDLFVLYVKLLHPISWKEIFV
jgi:hypothetical protein